MKPLELSDIVPLEDYAEIRDDFRRRIIGIKKFRRVSVGPRVTLVFENRDTVRFQVQEMCRAEHITAPDKVQEELDIYNALLPTPEELSATLFLEFEGEAELRAEMPDLLGIEEHVKFVLPGGLEARAKFEPGRSTEEKTSAVHYCRFAFSPEAREALRKGEDAFLEIDMPRYRARTRLNAEVRRVLAQDFE